MRHLLAFAAVMVSAGVASAQLRIRAPFVRIDVGGGVHVRAPFVNLYIPGDPPVMAAPPAVFVPPPPAPLDAPPNPGKAKAFPAKEQAPKEPPDAGPPPALRSQHLTIEDFVKSFKPKAGSYEVELLNPVTQQPTAVRFTLPEGTPRRVHVSPREIEFDYGARRYVKIQFDADGAVVIAR